MGKTSSTAAGAPVVKTTANKEDSTVSSPGMRSSGTATPVGSWSKTWGLIVRSFETLDGMEIEFENTQSHQLGRRPTWRRTTDARLSLTPSMDVEESESVSSFRARRWKTKPGRRRRMGIA